MSNKRALRIDVNTEMVLQSTISPDSVIMADSVKPLEYKHRPFS